MKRKLINGLVELSNIEVTMSIEQFKLYRNGSLSLLEIKIVNDLEEEIGWIFTNEKQLYKYIAICIAFLLTTTSMTVTSRAAGLDSIDSLGNIFLNIVRRTMYWICLIKGLVDVGREVSRGGDNIGNIGKIVLKYVLAFATLYIMPYLFDLVRDNF